MVTLLESAQVPLVIFHLNVFAPVPKLVTVVSGSVGVVIVPVPLIKLHNPVPTIAALAAIVVVAQTVCAGPALTGSGCTLLSIVIVRLLVKVVAPQLNAPGVSRVIVSVTV